MLITESVHFVDSSQSDFRGAISPLASSYADIALASGTESTLGPHKCIISSVRIMSIQDLSWRVSFWGKSYSLHTASSYADPSQLIGWSDHLDSTDNIPANWTGIHTTTATLFGTMYVSFITGLNIPYEDRQGTGRLHVNLENTSATAKSAGDVGLVHLRVGVVHAS